MTFVSPNCVTENRRTTGLLISQAKHQHSIDQITVTGGVKVLTGTVMGKQTSGAGKWVPCSLTAVDGSQVAAGILFGVADARHGDVSVAAVVRHTEIDSSYLTWDPSLNTAPARSAALAQLTTVGIVAR